MLWSVLVGYQLRTLYLACFYRAQTLYAPCFLSNQCTVCIMFHHVSIVPIHCTYHVSIVPIHCTYHVSIVPIHCTYHVSIVPMHCTYHVSIVPFIVRTKHWWFLQNISYTYFEKTKKHKVFAWESYGIPMAFPRDFHDVSMICLLDFWRNSMGFLREFFVVLMLFPCYLDNLSMIVLWNPYWVSMIFRWNYSGVSNESKLKSIENQLNMSCN